MHNSMGISLALVALVISLPSMAQEQSTYVSDPDTPFLDPIR